MLYKNFSNSIIIKIYGEKCHKCQTQFNGHQIEMYNFLTKHLYIKLLKTKGKK